MKYNPTYINVEETTSTNNLLKELYKREKETKEFTVISTEFQTSGKGQKGNSWESEKSKNLLFSFLLKPTFIEITKQFLLSEIAALSIKKALENYTDEISIKWPNDIYWRNKKICGILIENELNGTEISECIIGAGININQKEFFSDAPNPISLRNICNKEFNKEEVLQKVIETYSIYYQELSLEKSEEVQAEYFNALYRKEGYHKYSDKDGTFEAKIKLVKPTGILQLEDKSGKIREYAFKEVQYIIN